MMMTTSRRLRAIVALVFVNALWGISLPLMRMINALMDRAVPAESGTGSTAAVIVDQLTRESCDPASRLLSSCAGRSDETEAIWGDASDVPSRRSSWTSPSMDEIEPALARA
jgi:hypothetical protein